MLTSNPAFPTREQRAAMSGLQQMQAVLGGQLAVPPISKTLDFRLTEVSEGRAVFEAVPQQMHLNPMGGVHGGWYATLLDSAMGCAVHSSMPPGRGYTTAELGVNRGAVRVQLAVGIDHACFGGGELSSHVQHRADRAQRPAVELRGAHHDLPGVRVEVKVAGEVQKAPSGRRLIACRLSHLT